MSRNMYQTINLSCFCFISLNAKYDYAILALAVPNYTTVLSGFHYVKLVYLNGKSKSLTTTRLVIIPGWLNLPAVVLPCLQ